MNFILLTIELLQFYSQIPNKIFDTQETLEECLEAYDHSIDTLLIDSIEMQMDDGAELNALEEQWYQLFRLNTK